VLLLIEIVVWVVLCFVVASAAGQRACSLVCIAHGRIAAIVLMDR
jgi:hypothetical protein